MGLQDQVNDIIHKATGNLINDLSSPLGNDNEYVVAVALVPPPDHDHLDCLYINPQGAVQPNTSFAIGSLTKTFTATLLAYAATEDPGQFSYNSDDEQYRMGSFLPPFGGPGVSPLISAMSLRMLSQHMAGFFDSMPQLEGDEDWGSVLFQGKNPHFPPPTLTDFWAFYPEKPGGGQYDHWTPGTCWNYSDMGFVTLGYALISQWPGSATNYSDLLQIITGAPGQGAMPSTYTAWPPKDENPPPHPPVVQGFYNVESAPATDAPDIKSSIQDMWTWMNMNLHPLQVPDSTLHTALTAATTMFHPYPPTQPPTPCAAGGESPLVMGLAWQPGKLFPGLLGSPDIVWKDGGSSTGGCSSWIGMLFESPGPMGIAILANGWWDTSDTGTELPPNLDIVVDNYGHNILSRIAEALGN
jgi:beta-lactamase class C